MAVYQVPQFLDSGDKIFLGLNIRQFAYALVGLFACIITFQLTLAFLPILGNFALIPCIPVAALFGYLAWGKYNGRDSEIYVLKFILHSLKPRKMVFRRVPDLSDLNERFGELNEKALNQRLEERVKEQTDQDNDKFYNFNAQTSDTKAERIRNLGGVVDTSLVNTLSQIKEQEYKIQQTEELLQRVQQQNRVGGKSSPFKQLGSFRSSGAGGFQNPLLNKSSTQSTQPQSSSGTANQAAVQTPLTNPKDQNQEINVDNQNSQNFFDDILEK